MLQSNFHHLLLLAPQLSWAPSQRIPSLLHQQSPHRLAISPQCPTSSPSYLNISSQPPTSPQTTPLVLNTSRPPQLFANHRDPRRHILNF